MHDSYNKNVVILTFAINITLFTSLNQQQKTHVSQSSLTTKIKHYYDYIGKYCLVSRRNSYLFITTCIPITQECIAVILTKVSLVVLNNKSFDVVIYFHYITITHYFSFEKGHRSSFE